MLFIVACGLTHVVHAYSAVTSIENLEAHAAIGLVCAVASVGTAIAFAFILPQIKNLPSPAQQRAELERLVTQRTREKDQLIREINHRVGNQLQIISSILSLEQRRAETSEALGILDRLISELDKMAQEHVERSRRDYLELGVNAPGGAISLADGVIIAQSPPQPA